MERAFRLTILRRNQNLKAARRAEKKDFRRSWVQYNQQTKARDRALGEAIRTERKTRREDYLCGPLAPRRDVGKQRGLYGALDQSLAQRPTLPRSVILKEEHRLFATGDRVVVVRGRHAGAIGRIKEVNWETNSISIEGINTADVEIPRFSPMATQSAQRHTSVDVPLPVEDVRLVRAMMDTKTGTQRDVVIRYMHGGPPYADRDHTSTIPKHTRYVSGLDIPISWPKDNPLEYTDEPGDMSRLDVEELTHIHQLLQSPLPPGVEDELRNKHKRGKARFNEDYMGQKILQDAEAHWRRNRKLQTPQQEFHESQKKANQRDGQAELDRETLDIIHQTQALTLAGKSNFSASP